MFGMFTHGAGGFLLQGSDYFFIITLMLSLFLVFGLVFLLSYRVNYLYMCTFLYAMISLIVGYTTFLSFFPVLLVVVLSAIHKSSRKFS